tara:strand:- start:2068 stop:2706 length:639 start_codon:yes stop_codon:yes gene_type:complete
MKINYFDLGLYKAVELGWMVNKILPSLDVQDYSVYGFEACKEYYKIVSKKFSKNSKVSINHLAIANEEKTIRLYHSPNRLGHSIYSTKRHVNPKSFEDVPAMRFSHWLKENNIDLQTSFNIMKVNIEGAEWPLFQDLVDNDIVKHIDIFCGAGNDVKKVKELDSIVEDYFKLLEDNNIEIHRFSGHRPSKNKNIAKMIATSRATKIKNNLEQ